jgi:hypothetical protein
LWVVVREDLKAEMWASHLAVVMEIQTAELWGNEMVGLKVDWLGIQWVVLKDMMMAQQMVVLLAGSRVKQKVETMVVQMVDWRGPPMAVWKVVL